ELKTLEELREGVLSRMPMEALYVSVGEVQLLEKLLINEGELLLSDWDDLGAAEALVSRMWCSFHADGDDWTLLLPSALHEPLMSAWNVPELTEIRDRLFRYDATIDGLLYIAGLLHSGQPIEFFMHDVMRREDAQAADIARRYLQASFEYIADADGNLILLHPGLADPYHLVNLRSTGGMATLELTQEMIAGGMNGIFPEEEALHEAMVGALRGALRPDCDVTEAAEDLRILIKQGVSLHEAQAVMASLLAVMPTQTMNSALKRLYQNTPHWLGLKAALVH
ncbi:MAG: hypothetical protein RR521_11360, partial [Clostridia bacterium]